MPRKARPNRTDMLAQPVRVASGGKYGAAKASADAQAQVPLAQQQAMPAVPQGAPDMAQVLPQAQAFEMPQPLSAPTDYPSEPLMHGAPVGPGGGPEVLMNPGPDGLLLRGLTALQSAGSAMTPSMQRLADAITVQLHQAGQG